MTVDMSDFDRAVAEYTTKLEIAKKMRDMGADISFIVKVTGLSEKKITQSVICIFTALSQRQGFFALSKRFYQESSLPTTISERMLSLSGMLHSVFSSFSK
jgi:hypothetical protein